LKIENQGKPPTIFNLIRRPTVDATAQCTQY